MEKSELQCKQNNSSPMVPTPAPAVTTSPVATTVPATSSTPVISSSAPPIEHYHDLSDTTRLVASKPGMFWCYAHLMDMPYEIQSMDPRYCRECYEIFKAEYQDMVLTRGKRRPWWTPVNDSSHKTTPQVQEQGALIMSTSKAVKNTVDIFPPAPAVRRGPKKKSLPMELIAQLAGQGLGSKAIASRLSADGIAVSYRTIQRQLQGVMS